ncbi:MAG TPA: hypothetical protein VJL58_09415, partial [Pyrinomonadaceae bacterium]|nr:hypothetical protein [Pyrinomonadaceae bacterium]
VVELEAMPFLKRAAKSRRVWDLVYLGTLDIDDDTISDYLKRGVPLEKGALLIIEHNADRELPEKFGHLTRWRVINGDVAALTIYERK